MPEDDDDTPFDNPPPRPRPTHPTKRVAPASDDSPLQPQTCEELLPNGDLYAGTFSGNLPHGPGKYLWADGCMYEGDWRCGKPSGKGRLSWPSGATYEGEFRAGYMDGLGTYIGSSGDSYRGSWLQNLKHGFGQKCYANGDFYEGMWKKGLQEGHGRYVWKSGKEYVGEWKGGRIWGRGVLISENGDRFDGRFENGEPDGNGVLTWSDGSCYVGSWSRENPEKRSGSFYPPPKRAGGPEIDHEPVKRGILGRRICIWEADGEAGDITCDIVDGREWEGLARSRVKGVRGKGSPWCGQGEVKRQGQTISKGHKNYELMLNLQLGIRYSVGKPASSQTRELRSTDFDPKERIWTRFPPEGSKHTPPHQSVEFRWKDYCPVVFRYLRRLFKIDAADYMLSICGNDALRELSSPGKSGSFFYLTHDDRFMIKTMKKSEVKVLLRMLPSYYYHVCQYENSLVTKFFGLHCVKPVGGPKVRFIVMGNLFCSEYRIHRRFDLKGSSYGRSTDKSEGEIDETTTLKDLDLNFVFRLQRSWYEELLRQIDKDCEFLEAERIMDYSLLVGLHFKDSSTGMDTRHSTGELELALKDSPAGRLSKVETDWKPRVRLGAGMPARVEQVVVRRSDYEGGGVEWPHVHGEIYDVVMYFGVIDILQDYDITKKLEHAYKSFQVDPTSISAVDPKLYSKRFRDFVRRVFVEDK
ncbi:phosphatidylinositol 4-phosphate 5-kinase 1 [Amborella trichopoda]|uniref:Phosphatidylinositol 4-phosphate 5-kinase n=1 Tax=Amborella trichopoda TaxID=13333 RepID=W1P053_AMBTC|nr:phosphatidylinositol 4-phosphate 5-kinase 1 [Amborella trichopoda]ERN00946.1 hypothetical protein AMTR_s00002p00056060 [Amborella trichopoda]|eukprot:XP_006838377.1 phosphatidylinositol 4-phosphate 5-kinase 1 [Amborella trichopoda]